jgi:hypothetical protein
MKRFLPLLVAGLLSFLPSMATAQETVENELDFIQKLRSRGFNDLAKERLELLQKTGDPKLLAFLPLEQARTMVALARQKNPDQRGALLASARKQLQEFIAKNQGTPDAALANLEIARLSIYQGQAILSRALRNESNEDAHKEARPAEDAFKQAAVEVSAAIKALETSLENYKNADPAVEKAVKDRMRQELVQARFDVGAIIIEQAKTYLDTGKDAVNRERAVIIGKAGEVFDKLKEDASEPRIASLATAWLMKVKMENQEPDAAYANWKRVTGLTGNKAFLREVEPAQRLVRFFYMEDVQKNAKYTTPKTTPLQKIQLVQKEGKSWLAAYPTHLNTYEGQGVLYELAMAYLTEADNTKDKKAAATMTEQAQKYLKMLAAMDGDLSEKAKSMDLGIVLRNIEKKKDFKTFDDLYYKGFMERAQFNEIQKKLGNDKLKDEEKAKLEKEGVAHLKEAAKALSRAVAMATPRTPLDKLDDAWTTMTGAYMLSGDLQRAAISAEALGRVRPPLRRSAQAAQTAIMLYTRLAAEPANELSRKRLEDLTEFVLSPEVQKLWSGENVTSLARYELAMTSHKAGKVAEAIDLLEKLTPDFVTYSYAQGQMVFMLQELREKTKDPKEKKALVQKARTILERIKELPSDANASTAAMYFFANLERCKFLYTEAFEEFEKNKEQLKAQTKYQEMKQIAANLRDQLDKLKVKLNPETRDKIDFNAEVMMKYADFGQADLDYRLGNYDKVIVATQKVIDRVEAAAKKADEDTEAKRKTLPDEEKAKLQPEPIVFEDAQITGDVLGLALRAQILSPKGDVQKAKTMLENLRRLKGKGVDIESGNVVKNLLDAIALQIEPLRKEQGPAAKENLKKMVSKFSGFLEEIEKEYQKKGYDAGSAIMLAKAFDSLELHDKAAAVYGRYPAPKFLDNKKLTEEEESKVGTYWYFQIEQARSLRQSVESLKKDDPNKIKTLKEALDVLDKLYKHPNSKNQFLANMEKNQIWEEQGAYAACIKTWKAVLDNQNLKNQAAKGDNDAKRLYFTSYFYHTRVMYKYGQYDTKTKNGQAFIDAAAKAALKLEFASSPDGWDIAGPMYQALMREEEPFRKAYEKYRPDYKKTPAAK